jgi:ABC-2 type transport system permease protein
MDKFWVVAKREYLERVRSRWFIVMTLLVPALISGTFLVPVYVSAKAAGASSVRNIAILDASTAQLGARIADVLASDSSAMRRGGPAPTRLQVRVVAPNALAATEDSLTREVMRPNSLTGYLLVDDSTLSGARARYAGRNASSLPEVDKLRSAVRQAVMAIRLEREGVRASTIAELNKLPLRMPTQRIDERGRGSSGQAGFFLGIGIGVLLLMSIIFHGQQVLRGVLEEKTSRVAEIVISSVKPETLLAGKVAGNGAVGLTQQLLWIAMSAYLINSVAPILLKNAIPDAAAGAGAASASSIGISFGGLSLGLFAAVLLYFLLGFIFYASLLAAAGAMVNSEQDAQQAAMPVTFMLIGTWLFVNSVLLNPSGRIAVVLSWLPFSSPIVMPMRVGLSSIPWYHVAGSLLVCALGCVAAVWLAARIYRVGMLMYGKRPSIAEVVKWVRYA